MTAGATHTLRPPVFGRHGMVVAGNAESAKAGADMLRAGGNAMDAAIAASAALAVTIPYMNGLGGDAFALWYDHGSGKAAAINGSGAAPRAATAARYAEAGLTEVPVRGPFSISVPGLVHAWGEAAGRFGTRDLGTLLEPAIALADGMPMGRQFAEYCNSDLYAAQCREHPRLEALFGRPGGRRLGEPLGLPALARTLRSLAQDGPKALHGGRIGAALAAEVQAQGGLLALEDLAGHETRLQPPLDLDWLGGRLLTCPPNAQGMVLSLLAALLQEAAIVVDDPAFAVTLLRAKQIAFAERDRLLGDPDMHALPDDLIAANRIAGLWRGGAAEEGARRRAATGDTTCLVAVDRHGNAVSWVQSLYDEFGSQVASEETGIVLQNRLSLASLRPGLPSFLRPGYRPPHTLCPALYLGDGRCRIAIATPGGHGQAQTLAQVLLRVLQLGQDVQSAIEAPRFCQEHDSTVMYESRMDRTAVDLMRAGGHALEDVGPWSHGAGLTNAIGAVVAIGSAPDGMLSGGADPRRDCYAVAV